MVSKDEFRSAVKNQWIKKGTWDSVVSFYEGLDQKPDSDVLERRKQLIKELEDNLMIPEQKKLLNYVKSNPEDILFFENGGTFGFFLDNFAGIIYADALSHVLKERGKNAVCFTVIDPTDISRVERTLVFGGNKFKIPITEEGITEGISTDSIKPPEKQIIEEYLDKLKKELVDSIRVPGFYKEDQKVLINRFEDLRSNILDSLDQSNSYRDFTNKVLVDLIAPLTKNSIFVTLKQWQSTWNLKDVIYDARFYATMDRVYSQIKEVFGNAPNPINVQLQENVFRFPFRIDDGKQIYKPHMIGEGEEKQLVIPAIDIKTKEICYYPLRSGKKGSTIMGSSEINDATFLMMDGLLYAFDSVMYNAINLAPEEDRVLFGYILGSAMRNAKRSNGNIFAYDSNLENIISDLGTPILCEHMIPFYSTGRVSKKAPGLKTSGAVAAYIEGLDADYFLEEFKKLDAENPKIESPTFKKYGQER